jgi:ribosomal protein S6
MSETTMPAAEATEAMLENEQNSYELAFHILPTVAEGEVQGVFDAIKALITKDGGQIFDEEAPLRFELAYEIVKHLEGKNRKFTSAYFGWARFKMSSDAVLKLQEEVEGRTDVLRYILIKLTKTEEENPFRFHEAIESFKMVTTIDEADLVADEVLEDEADEITDEVILEEVTEEKSAA